VVWPTDFQFDSTVDGKAIKIASMIDEHTRQSLLNIVERSITAQRLTDELDKTFALWDASAADGQRSGVHFPCAATFLPRPCRYLLHPAGDAVEQRTHRIRQQSTTEGLNRNHWTSLLEARVVIEDFKDHHNHRHRHSSLGYLTPSWGSLPLAGAYAARCTHNHQPVEGWEVAESTTPWI